MPEATPKYDSGKPHIVLPVAAPDGGIHSIAIPPDVPLPDLHGSLVDAGYHLGDSKSQPSADDVLERDATFRKRAADAWEQTQMGKQPEEAGFTVQQDGSYGPTVRTRNEPTGGNINMPYTSKTREVVHTHSNYLQSNPSEQDIASAKAAKMTIYVVSRDGLFAVSPGGDVTHVYDSPSWYADKNKKNKK